MTWISKQLHHKNIYIAIILLFNLLVLLAVYVLGTIRNISIGVITRDPATTSGQIFIGMLSYLDFILWTATAAICYMGAILLNQKTDNSRFLLISGLFTTILLFDDAFVLHDEIIPRLFHIREWPVYLGYLLLVLIYITFFLRKLWSSPERLIFLSALFFFGISITMDVFFDSFPTLALQPLFEDGCKFIGISLWFSYFSLTVLRLVEPHLLKNQA